MLHSTLGRGNSAHVGNECRQQLCVENCGQTSEDGDIVTTNSQWDLVIALSNGTIVEPVRRTV